MKIAVVQFAPVLGDLDATIQKLEPLLSQAYKAHWVILPELANSGYNFTSYNQAWDASEAVDNSVFISFLVGKCQQYNFNICTGFCERDGGKMYNSSLVINSGGIIAKYRKLHLFMREKEIFEAGDMGLTLVDVDGVRVGMLICFDWMFPEVWRSLALKGADIIFHPANLVLPYAQSVVASYALVNRVFVVTANRVWTEDSLHFTGQSVVVNPKGVNLIDAHDSEEVLITEIDPLLARDKMITPLNDAFDDRRTDVY